MGDHRLMSQKPDPTELREIYRRQMLGSIGGWSGTVIAAIPTVVFVIVNAVASLRAALIAAVGSALLLTAYRLARKQSIQQALSGLIGVVVAALIAERTGQARGYFLLGIITSFVYAVPFLVSIIVRRPLVGLLWEFLDATPGTGGENAPKWYRVPVLLRAYQLATLGGLIVFLARGVVQLTLYGKNATGWLAFARIVMGFPLYIAAVGVGYWLIRAARQQVAASAMTDGTEADQKAADKPEQTSGSDAEHGHADRSLGLWQRDEE